VRQQRGEKLLRHRAVQQPVAVLGEGGGVPYRVLDAEPDKPAEQQIVIDPLNQLPLRADRIERLQQQGSQQPLRRDRLAADRRVQRIKIARQRLQRRVCDAAGHPQRVIRGNPLLKIDVAEQIAADRVVAAHRHPLTPRHQGISDGRLRQPFSAAC
jgi:hypothetical protein